MRARTSVPSMLHKHAPSHTHTHTRATHAHTHRTRADIVRQINSFRPLQSHLRESLPPALSSPELSQEASQLRSIAQPLFADDQLAADSSGLPGRAAPLKPAQHSVIDRHGGIAVPHTGRDLPICSADSRSVSAAIGTVDSDSRVAALARGAVHGSTAVLDDPELPPALMSELDECEARPQLVGAVFGLACDTFTTLGHCQVALHKPGAPPGSDVPLASRACDTTAHLIACTHRRGGLEQTLPQQQLQHGAHLGVGNMLPRRLPPPSCCSNLARGQQAYPSLPKRCLGSAAQTPLLSRKCCGVVGAGQVDAPDVGHWDDRLMLASIVRSAAFAVAISHQRPPQLAPRARARAPPPPPAALTPRPRPRLRPRACLPYYPEKCFGCRASQAPVL